MQRSLMRFAGRLTVAALLAVMVLAIVTSPEEVHRHYMAKYDQFRNMLYMLRVADLPPSSYIEGLFDIFRYIDLTFLSLSGLLIVSGFRLGPWMMVFYWSLKSFIFYIPPLVNIPRVIFISRDVFEMMRHFALLGSAIALTYSTPKEQNPSVPEPTSPQTQKDS